jgi:photosystem II stability/assembly factor-like uncharacterized protein
MTSQSMRMTWPGAGLAAACCLLVAGCGASHPASHPAAGQAAATAALTRASRDRDVSAAGASFISPSAGWVLGRSGCQACAVLLHTANGGRTWQRLPAPPAQAGTNGGPSGSIGNIAFGNARDGFLFGPGLLASYDGGRTWTRQALPPVQDLVVGGTYAYAVTGTPFTASTGLWRTRLGSARWTRLPMPPDMMPASGGSEGELLLYAEGGTLAALQTGDFSVTDTQSMAGRLWLSTNHGARWQERTVPCQAPTGGGAAVMSIALGHPDAWLLDCFNNEQSSQEQNTQHRLYGSVSAGKSWVLLPDPTSHNMPELLADNGSEHAFLATQGDADDMVGTLDAGLHWRVMIDSGGSFSGWADLAFLTARVGYVVGPTSDDLIPGHLYRTTNGGKTWLVVRL